MRQRAPGQKFAEDALRAGHPRRPGPGLRGDARAGGGAGLRGSALRGRGVSPDIPGGADGGTAHRRHLREAARAAEPEGQQAEAPQLYGPGRGGPGGPRRPRRGPVRRHPEDARGRGGEGLHPDLLRRGGQPLRPRHGAGSGQQVYRRHRAGQRRRVQARETQ